MEARQKVRFQGMPGGLVMYVEDLRALLQELADKAQAVALDKVCEDDYLNRYQ